MSTRLEVDLPQLAANISAVRARMVPAEVMYVVKNDAYGLGLEHTVPTAKLSGISWYGTFDVRTGCAVRHLVGEGDRIFCWLSVGDDDIQRALDADLDLGVGDLAYLERIIRGADGRELAPRVHLKIDTGLRRNGVLPEQWPQMLRIAAEAEDRGVIEVAGIWSHLAETSDQSDDEARAVYHEAVRQAIVAGIKPEVQHLAASAAAWHRPEFRLDLVRVGAFCAGIRSTDGPELVGICPAMRLVATVIEVLPDTVTIDLGAADGLFPALSGRCDVGTPAGGRPLREVWSMTSKVASWPGAEVGDEVVVFGPGDAGESTPTTLAEAIGTIGEELLLRLSPRIPRRQR